MLNKMPGLEDYTIGYITGDGNLFYGCGIGHEFGPKFGTDDVVGCGLNLSDMSVFFTKNGRFLGVVLCNLPEMT